MQKPRSNALVEADAGGNVLNVRIHGFGQIGHGVDEGYLQCQKCVGRMLDDLGTLRRSNQQLGRTSGAASPRKCVGLPVITAPCQRLINAPKQIGCALTSRAHHNAVGMQEVDNRCAFAQELGV